MKEKTKRPWKHSLRLILLILLAVIVFAYGFDVTQVSLKEISSTRRQESLTRVLRALARPDIFEYEQVDTVINTPIYVPCQAGAPEAPRPDVGKPYMVVTPSCAAPRAQVRVNGYNFMPNTMGPLSFIPPSEVTLRLGEFETDARGTFSVTVKLPPRPSDQVQYVRAVTSQRVGLPHFTQTARDTWSKIVETVFMALLATTFGVMLSIPISFLAARNIMKDVTSTISGLSLGVIVWPLGMVLGAVAASWIGRLSQPLSDNFLLVLGGLVVSLLLVLLAIRWALPEEGDRIPSQGLRIGRALVMIAAAMLVVLSMFFLARLSVLIGQALAVSLDFFSFIGTFLANIGEITNALIVVVTSLAVGGYLAMNLVLGAVAGAVLALMISLALNWLYQFNQVFWVYVFPAALGAVLGILTAVLTREKDSLPVGLVVYYIIRTILNALRAIEALIMAIVFVVWVGIGPFAGVLALSLHTVAALAKLYSEQVESISAGPLEAVRATGATRFQTIVYAVIPQIIPPYISFTMYRWDINVRMSTIIGFAGGGGIGFLLIQNINLLNYRAASAQMLAIAVVVGLMDYMSSYMRERVI
jgi:phosphonate ABC transporter permease subunit PhnE